MKKMIRIRRSDSDPLYLPFDILGCRIDRETGVIEKLVAPWGDHYTSIYVDVGCKDAITIENLHARDPRELELKLVVRGILIDADPTGEEINEAILENVRLKDQVERLVKEISELKSVTSRIFELSASCKCED